MSRARDALFTPDFLLMCGFSFCVFVSAFMLLPTAPFRILATGGGELEAGMFLGLLTYASALSAPLTGSLADRVGRRRMLIACGSALTLFSLAYGLTTGYRVPLLLVPLQGVFWSGLLSASSAHTADLIPESRRAEGLSYWGMATILAIAVAPGTGFWLYRRGWGVLCAACAALNLAMTGIALRLRDTRGHASGLGRPRVEWRLLATSFTLFLYSFGYGGITSFVALYAEHSGIAPKGLYFTALALTILATRPFSGPLSDRLGHRRVLLPCLVLIALGLALLALPVSRGRLLLSALVFGAGFGSAYPAYAAHLMRQVPPQRRGAAFGSILAAFDIGIGTGSIVTGALVARLGFAPAFGVAALLASLSLPYFLFAERRFIHGSARREDTR